MSNIWTQVGTFFTNVFGENGYASTLVTWLTTTGHEIALIPLYAYIFVMVMGGIKRLIPGV